MKNIIKKLKSQNGESIVETLVALLISALAITLLAMMIQTSSNLIKKNDEQFTNYIEKENVLVDKAVDTDALNGQVYITGTSKIYLIDSNDSTVKDDKYYEVNCFVNKTKDIEVISYKLK